MQMQLTTLQKKKNPANSIHCLSSIHMTYYSTDYNGMNKQPQIAFIV